MYFLTTFCRSLGYLFAAYEMNTAKGPNLTEFEAGLQQFSESIRILMRLVRNLDVDELCANPPGEVAEWSKARVC